MPRISEIHDVDFNGVEHPYVPPERLNISDKLKLHQTWDRDVDPVTYEVIRHNLWQINEEHGSNNSADFRISCRDVCLGSKPVVTY